MIALLFDYLVESRGWKNGVAKSVATTNLVNALADHHKVQLHETPVGFKYIGELIKKDEIASAAKRARDCRFAIMFPRKMACSRDCCAARWWQSRPVDAENNCGTYLPKLVRIIHYARTSA